MVSLRSPSTHIVHIGHLHIDVEALLDDVIMDMNGIHRIVRLNIDVEAFVDLITMGTNGSRFGIHEFTASSDRDGIP
jgi:hypothetical protein